MRLPVLFLVGLAVLTGCTSTGRTVDALPSTTPSPASSASPTSDPEPGTELQFLLDDEFYTGDAVRLRMRNVGERAYIYRTTYAACDLTYTDADGREFLIPPGTHCDLVSKATIKPGQTVSLFVWRLNECVKDRWGCVRSKPLLPGAYTISGQFSPVGKGETVDVTASFVVAAA
ncbi:MAG: hypothetical protein LH645_02710 [Actinomycetia bacterium]|nr:hypothetical protein [Actinomycetes bacterium]